MFTKIICVDFDGVLHSYSSGWKGLYVVADSPVEGAIEWLRSVIDEKESDGSPRFEIAIYSSRSKEDAGIGAMMAWLGENGLESSYVSKITFPTQKPAAFLTIDDRCIQFQGTFPSGDDMAGFIPWNKKGD